MSDAKAKDQKTAPAKKPVGRPPKPAPSATVLAAKAHEALKKKALKAFEAAEAKYMQAKLYYESFLEKEEEEPDVPEDPQGELEHLADSWIAVTATLYHGLPPMSGVAKSEILKHGSNAKPEDMEEELKEIIAEHLGGSEEGPGCPDLPLVLKRHPDDARKWLFCSIGPDGKCMLATDYVNEEPAPRTNPPDAKDPK